MQKKPRKYTRILTEEEISNDQVGTNYIIGYIKKNYNEEDIVFIGRMVKYKSHYREFRTNRAIKDNKYKIISTEYAINFTIDVMNKLNHNDRNMFVNKYYDIQLLDIALIYVTRARSVKSEILKELHKTLATVALVQYKLTGI